MKRIFIWTIVAGGLSAAICGFAGGQTSAPSIEDYSVIYQRNIFDKSRRPAREIISRPVDPTPVRPPEPPRTERNFVLRGIVREGSSDYVAFIENTRDGSIRTLRAGDSIAEGALKEINLNGITYESDRGTAKIEIGSNFEGTAIAPVRTTSSTGSPGSTGASSGLSERELLERLRQRREQESGRSATTTAPVTPPTEGTPATGEGAPSVPESGIPPEGGPSQGPELPPPPAHPDGGDNISVPPENDINMPGVIIIETNEED